MMKKDSILFVSFQPIYSPFGGHQHSYKGLIKYIPYIHLLPNCIYYKLINNKVDDGLHTSSKEMREIKENKMSIRYFEDLVKNLNLKIINKEFYITRPTFKIAYNIPIIRNRIKKKKILTELITSGCKYILKK